MASNSDIVQALLDRHGQTFCREPAEEQTSSALPVARRGRPVFSTQNSTKHGEQAAKGLFDEDLTTLEKMRDSMRKARVKIFNSAG